VEKIREQNRRAKQKQRARERADRIFEAWSVNSHKSGSLIFL
jgi:hypothetical protein